MSKAKKSAKNTIVAFRPNQISAQVKQAMVNYQNKHLAKMSAAAKAKDAEEKTLAAKTKGIEVEDLRKAISLGLSFREAAYVGLKAVEELTIMKNESDEAPDLDWMEEFIRYLFKKNDHTLRFEAEEDESEGFVNWSVTLDPWEEGVFFSLSYLVTEMDRPESCAEEDADTLNQFILDFYGIKEHKVDPARMMEELKFEISGLEMELKDGQKRLKELKSKLNGLLRPAKGKST